MRLAAALTRTLQGIRTDGITRETSVNGRGELSCLFFNPKANRRARQICGRSEQCYGP